VKPRLLIVDDEPSLARVLQPVLETDGWTVFTASTAVEALKLARERLPDLVLLDLGLPDADGKELIPVLKAGSRLEIIVVSARHMEAEKVAALDAGADDYVDKPFGIHELAARVRATRRRISPGRPQARLEGRHLTIDVEARSVHLLGERVKLSPKEFELLRTLAEYDGRVVTQRRLLLAGWGDPDADVQYLRTYIALLRQKLEEDPAEPRLLLTEPGVGYRLSLD
jgi:two-component system, OmpR family, KDP operon response regulator KdpE